MQSTDEVQHTIGLSHTLADPLHICFAPSPYQSPQLAASFSRDPKIIMVKCGLSTAIVQENGVANTQSPNPSTKSEGVCHWLEPLVPQIPQDGPNPDRVSVQNTNCHTTTGHGTCPSFPASCLTPGRLRHVFNITALSSPGPDGLLLRSQNGSFPVSNCRGVATA